MPIFALSSAGSLNFPLEIRLEIVGVTVLAEGVVSIDTAEFEIFTFALDVVVDHVDQDCSAKETLFLKHDIDVVELVANSLFLLLS